MMRTICCCGLAFLLSGSLVGADTWHVDIAHPAGGNGTTWATAFTYLQDALDAASSGDTIEVAGSNDPLDPAIYHPDDGAGHTQGDRTETFTLVSGIEMLGGYIGYDDDLPDTRDFEEFLTVLSGDLADNDGPDPFDNNDENSYHVVFGLSLSDTTVLDGFIIEAGNADGPGWGDGAGMYLSDADVTIANCTVRFNWADGDGGGAYLARSAPALEHCTFRGNRGFFGGGMYWSDYDFPILIDCVFDGNTAVEGGGIMTTWAYSGTLVNCLFIGNSADAGVLSGDGGALHTMVALTLTNCIFVDNSADDNGGAVWNGSDSILTNCTFFGNVADEDDNALGDGGGMWTISGDPSLTNCILWGNTDSGGTDESAQIHVHEYGDATVNYTCIDGLIPDGDFDNGTNIGDDPDFADPPDDLRLSVISPCIDVGDNGAVPDDEWDVDGDSNTDEPTPELDLYPRILAGPTTNLQCEKVDMGAYEYAVACPSNCFDGDECTPPYQCTEDDVCEYVCRDREYGDITPFGAVVPPCTAEDRATIGDGFSNMLDVFCAFNGFNGGFPYTLCPCGDVSPCGGDGFVNLLDVFALFDAFNGIDLCAHPCVCDDCGEAMAMGGGASEGSRIVESGDILVGILATIAPVSVDRYKYGVEAIADWLIERMTMDQRSALADKLQDPSQKFANDRVARMVPAIVSALRGE